MTSTVRSGSGSLASIERTDDERDAEQGADDEQRHDRVGHLERDVLAALMRQPVVAAAEPEHDEHDQRDHEDPDDHRRDQHAVPDLLDVAGLLGERRRQAAVHPHSPAPTDDGGRLGLLLLLGRLVVATACVAHDHAGPLGAIGAGPRLQRPADPVRRDVNDRRHEQTEICNDGRDVADRRPQRRGEDVLRAGERTARGRRSGPPTPIAVRPGRSRGRSRRWCSTRSCVNCVLEERPRVQQPEREPGHHHARPEQLGDRVAERCGPHGGKRRSDPSSQPMYQSGCAAVVTAPVRYGPYSQIGLICDEAAERGDHARRHRRTGPTDFAA